MNEKQFQTLIKGDHKLGQNEYVKGRISGIQYALLGEFGPHYSEFAYRVNKETGNTIMAVIATPENYEYFSHKIEKLYPGLCIFDYQD